MLRRLLASTCAAGLHSVPTFQERLDVAELACVVELPEVLGLLREVFPLGQRVSLVRDNVGCDRVQLGNQRGEVDVWRMSACICSAFPWPYFSMPQLPFGTCCPLRLLLALLSPAWCSAVLRPASSSPPCLLRPPSLRFKLVSLKWCSGDLGSGQRVTTSVAYI